MKEYKYKINGNQYNVTIGDIEDNIAHVEVNGTPYKVEMEKAPKKAMAVKPVVRPVHTDAPTAPTTPIAKPAAVSGGKSGVKSPLPGVILDIKVNVGDTVKKGQTIIILEGIATVLISLDNFYLDTDQTPLNRKGKPDFESIYALDIERINRCIDELVNQGTTIIPIFDFHVRRRLEGAEERIVLSDDDVVIIEGLHGLNPLLTQLVGEDKVTRIFASVRSRFTDHDRVILTPQDVRLMRRMVRDCFTRNTRPEDTMAMWEEVCEGESEYINPYRDSAAFKLDTTLDYEPNIFHSYLLPFLDRTDIAPEYYRKIDDLYQRLDEFFDINDVDAIPADSVIREFIGKK